MGEQLADGGWNCEAENGSARSSFNTTICVLEALLAWERAGGSAPEVPAARHRGEEYLLERHLLRRLSTGERITTDRKGGTDPGRAAFPTWWHYDVLRALEHLRAAGSPPDHRVAEAVDLVASRRGRRRPLGAGAGARRHAAGRPGRGRGRTEPVGHPPRAAGAALGGTPLRHPASSAPVVAAGA